jgi:manganese oxidase
MNENDKQEPAAEPGLRLPAVTRRTALASGLALALGPALAAAAQAQEAPGRPLPRRRGQGRRPEPPWAEAERARLRPGEPGRDYRPAFVPNLPTLPYRIVDGVKVFHLVAEPILHELARGLVVNAWGYNGTTPGPLIEAAEGDRVRIYVSNRLPAPTTVHWHGMLVPNGMDGVPGLTQPEIPPGQTARYEFVLPHAGTFMYHTHFDAMVQDALGLVGMFVVHPRRAADPPDRDFVILLQEWFIRPGTSRPDPFEMSDFNVLTMNGRAFPDVHPLVCQLGDRVRVRIGNLSPMSHHPIHLHGFFFHITATDGGVIPVSARWPETTVLVPVGSSREIEFVADNPGDWPLHCHMTHHMMNQMGHGVPNMVGVQVPAELEQKIRSLLPGYMTMGQAGMADMIGMRMPVPENSIPMRGLTGQFGPSEFGGMATLVKVREHAPGYEDVGWYDFPPGSIAAVDVSPDELRHHGIEPPPPGAQPPAGHHGQH